jgi:hypothetical protein
MPSPPSHSFAQSGHAMKKDGWKQDQHKVVGAVGFGRSYFVVERRVVSAQRCRTAARKFALSARISSTSA